MIRPVAAVDVERLLFDVWSSEPTMAEKVAKRGRPKSEPTEPSLSPAVRLLADRIARLKAFGISQTDLGNWFGLNKTSLSEILTGRREPTDRQLTSIASILRIDMAAFRDGRLVSLSGDVQDPFLTYAQQRLQATFAALATSSRGSPPAKS